MNKQFIEIIISNIYYQKVFPDISSPDNIWNKSDDKCDKEESISYDYTNFQPIYIFILKLWNQKEKHIYTNYAVTGWMLYVIPHIVRDVFKNSQNKHHIQVNIVMKSLFDGSSEKELHETLDT